MPAYAVCVCVFRYVCVYTCNKALTWRYSFGCEDNITRSCKHTHTHTHTNTHTHTQTNKQTHKQTNKHIHTQTHKYHSPRNIVLTMQTVITKRCVCVCVCVYHSQRNIALNMRTAITKVVRVYVCVCVCVCVCVSLTEKYSSEYADCHNKKLDTRSSPCKYVCMYVCIYHTYVCMYVCVCVCMRSWNKLLPIYSLHLYT